MFGHSSSLTLLIISRLSGLLTARLEGRVSECHASKRIDNEADPVGRKAFNASAVRGRSCQGLRFKATTPKLCTKRFLCRASFLDDMVAMLIFNAFDDLGCRKRLGPLGPRPVCFKTGKNPLVRLHGVTLQLANQKHLLFDGNRIQCLPSTASQAALSGFLGPSAPGLLHDPAPAVDTCTLGGGGDGSPPFPISTSAKSPIHLERKLQDLSHQLLREYTPLLGVSIPGESRHCQPHKLQGRGSSSRSTQRTSVSRSFRKHRSSTATSSLQRTQCEFRLYKVLC